MNFVPVNPGDALRRFHSATVTVVVVQDRVERRRARAGNEKRKKRTTGALAGRDRKKREKEEDEEGRMGTTKRENIGRHAARAGPWTINYTRWASRCSARRGAKNARRNQQIDRL